MLYKGIHNVCCTLCIISFQKKKKNYNNNIYIYIYIYSSSLHLFDPKYSKISNIVKYFYYLKYAEKSALITEINYILKYIQIESSYFK